MIIWDPKLKSKSSLGDGALSEILQKISIPIRKLTDCKKLPGWTESIEILNTLKNPDAEIGMLRAWKDYYDTCLGKLIKLWRPTLSRDTLNSVFTLRLG